MDDVVSNMQRLIERDQRKKPRTLSTEHYSRFVIRRSGLLPEFCNHVGQAGLVAVSVPFVNQVGLSGPVEKASYISELLESRIFVCLLTNIFKRSAQMGAISSVAKSLGGRSFHPLSTGFMIWQVDFLSVSYFQINT